MELHLTVEELLALIGSLDSEPKARFAEKLLDKILTDKVNIIHYQHSKDDPQVQEEAVLSQDDKKFRVLDQISWISYYVYDFIRYEYSSEIKDYFILEEQACKKKHDNINFSMTVGGCTQITNKLKMPPFLKIFKSGHKRIGANKYYLEAFEHFRQELFSEYLLELKTRGFALPENNRLAESK